MPSWFRATIEKLLTFYVKRYVFYDSFDVEVFFMD